MKRLIITIVASAFFGVITPALGSGRTETYVLIITNNQSRDPAVAPLQYADDDGVKYYELFRQQTENVALFTVLDSDSAVLHSHVRDVILPPTRQNILGRVNAWQAQIEQQNNNGVATEFIIVYAGHGDVDKNGEGYINLLDGKFYRRDLYHQLLTKIKTTYVHLIVDACRSYFFVHQRGSRGSDVSQQDYALLTRFLRKETLADNPQVGAILATSGDQATHEWQRYRGGIFSHELRSALSGAADINNDGRIEYSEIHAFIAAANAKVSHAQAKLSISVSPPLVNRNLALFDLNHLQHSRFVNFSAQDTGAFYLEDERGVRLADFNKSAGSSFKLALHKNRLYFLNRQGLAAQIPAGPQPLQLSALNFSRPELAAREASIERSFRQQLFALPYSKAFYDGFVTSAGHLPVTFEASPGGGTFVASATGASSPLESVHARPSAPEGVPGDPHIRVNKHSVAVGYLMDMALLDLSGVNHGLQLNYRFDLWRYFSVGAYGEYGTSTHATARLHRLGFLAQAAGRYAVLPWLELMAETTLGYQLYWSSNPVTLQASQPSVEGTNSKGMRVEFGGGLRISAWAPFVFDIRGGGAANMVPIDNRGTSWDLTPYFATSLGYRF